jgi:hypothetical protein
VFALAMLGKRLSAKRCGGRLFSRQASTALRLLNDGTFDGFGCFRHGGGSVERRSGISCQRSLQAALVPTWWWCAVRTACRAPSSTSARTGATELAAVGKIDDRLRRGADGWLLGQRRVRLETRMLGIGSHIPF